MTVALEAALATVVGADHVRPIPGQPALAVTPGSPTERSVSSRDRPDVTADDVRAVDRLQR